MIILSFSYSDSIRYRTKLFFHLLSSRYRVWINFVLVSYELFWFWLLDDVFLNTFLCLEDEGLFFRMYYALEESVVNLFYDGIDVEKMIYSLSFCVENGMEGELVVLDKLMDVIVRRWLSHQPYNYQFVILTSWFKMQTFPLFYKRINRAWLKQRILFTKRQITSNRRIRC